MMQTLLEAGRAAWPFDWEPMQMGVEDGIVWAICPGRMGGINGYVLIPAEGHPWSAGVPQVERDGREDSAADDLEVHGGITYHGESWLGFDTLHAFDVWPPEFDPQGICQMLGRGALPTARYWSVDAVIAEVKDLARQLSKIGSL